MSQASAAELPVAIGQQLGKYKVTEVIGAGAMGVVFGGVHETLGREVAIKLLRGQYAKDESVVARFIQEAEAVSRIGHANIIAVYDFGRLDDGSVYYVMERIRGETLSARVRSGVPMEQQEIVAIFSQIARALHATHTRGIVHRDLKPDNVMLVGGKPGSPPHVKVVDFGVAKMREVAGGGLDAQMQPGAASNLTTAGMLLGTPTYMAPEQILASQHVDGRADLYALGAMLYEALTGQPPFGRGEVMLILTRHVREHAAPPSTKTDRPIPPALDEMVLKSLAKKPEQRQPDANAFIAELEAAYGVKRASSTGQSAALSGSDRSSPSGRSQPGAPSSASQSGAAKGRLPLVAAGVGVLLLGGGAAAFLGLRKSEGPKPVAVVAPRVAESPLHVEANKILATALGGDAQQRRAAVEAMGEVGDHAALDQIVTELGDDNPEIRRAAANAAIAIGKPGDQALLTALVAASQQSGGSVAVDLAAARLHIGDQSAIEDLQRALAQRDPAARLRAAVALAEAAKLDAVALRQAIAGAPPTVRRSLRWSAYTELYQLGDATFTAELRAALAGTDAVAKLDAAQTLARAHNPDGATALAALAQDAPDPVDRVDAATVQAALGDVGALDSLAASLADKKPAVRARAATSLGKLAPSLPDQAALERQLSPLLNDSEGTVRVAAAAALLAVKSPTPSARKNP